MVGTADSNWRGRPAFVVGSPGFSQGSSPGRCRQLGRARALSEVASRRRTNLPFCGRLSGEYAPAGTHNPRYGATPGRTVQARGTGRTRRRRGNTAKQDRGSSSMPTAPRTRRMSDLPANAWRLWDMLAMCGSGRGFCGHETIRERQRRPVGLGFERGLREAGRAWAVLHVGAMLRTVCGSRQARKPQLRHRVRVAQPSP